MLRIKRVILPLTITFCVMLRLALLFLKVMLFCFGVLNKLCIWMYNLVCKNVREGLGDDR